VVIDRLPAYVQKEEESRHVDLQTGTCLDAEIVPSSHRIAYANVQPSELIGYAGENLMAGFDGVISIR
jgi:hypothetical protein